jgi:hypothetical protein
MVGLHALYQLSSSGAALDSGADFYETVSAEIYKWIKIRNDLKNTGANSQSYDF